MRGAPQGGATGGRLFGWTSYRAVDLLLGGKALAHPPSRDTPQGRADGGGLFGWISYGAVYLPLGCKALARHRGTRRKYVRVGPYAASMPRKVPRR
ncbi:hypothetical protein C1H21_14650 [Xanthomonas arboricola pv. juglandis]|nr:hypothetical protein C1H21_14650 [Xanthomonas arboricola pv. juglandis]